MPTGSWLSRLVLAVLALLVGARGVLADVDMTGRWLGYAFSFGGDPIVCQDFVQVGPTLSVTPCEGGGPSTGTIDPVTGAFTVDTITATVAPDGLTYAGTSTIYLCRFTGCFLFTFDVYGARCGGATAHPLCGGPRCGDGVVDPNEECDGGDCCGPDCRFTPSGSACDADADPATPDTCDAAGTCIPEPSCGPCRVHEPVTRVCRAGVRTDCRRPTVPAGRVAFGRDAFAWTWERGAVTAVDDFGDPSASTDYRLCLFADDAQGGTGVLLAATVPHGGSCGAGSCWQRDRAFSRYRYRRTAADGIRSMLLKSGPAGSAKVIVKGTGAGLGLPGSLAGVHLPVTVQLERADAPLCWAARFTTAQQLNAAKVGARDGE